MDHLPPNFRSSLSLYFSLKQIFYGTSELSHEFGMQIKMQFQE